MSAKRVDNFAGDDFAYVGYLYHMVTKVSVAELIPQLEQQAVSLRNSQSLHVEFWKPNIEDKPAQPRKEPSWESRTENFLKELPVSEEQWSKKRRNARLSNADDVLRTVDCLVTGSLGLLNDDNNDVDQEFQDSSCSPAEKAVAAALSSTATKAGALIAAAKHSNHVAQFFSLVFMAECKVALFTGHPEDSVNNAIRKFIKDGGGTCVGEKVPALLLSTTLWVLQEQQRQFRRGLLHRSFELFFNGKRVTSLPLHH